MAAATCPHRSSPNPRPPLNHYPLTHYPRPRLPYHRDSSDSERSESDCSDQRQPADRNGLQGVRAKVSIKPSATRPAERDRKSMAAYTTRRSSGTVREVSRAHSSKSRHRAERDKDDDVDVHIIKRHRSSKGSKDKFQPGLWRRSTTTGVASRLKEERSYRDRESLRRSSDGRTPTRKHSERRTNTKEPITTPVRRQRHPTVDDVANNTREGRQDPVFIR